MRRLIVSLAIVSLVGAGFPRRAIAADDAAALLAKHAVFTGWKGGDGSVKTLRESGVGERDGKVVVRIARLQEGVIYRAIGARTFGTYQGGFTGNVFWQSNDNGFTVRTVGEAIKYLATEIAIENEELTSQPGTVRASATVDGVQTTIVRVTPDVGLPVDLYIDPQTGAYKRIAIDPDGKYEESYDVLGYTDVGHGKQVVSSWRFVGGRTIYRYTDIQANTVILPEELHPPKAVATWSFGPPAQTAPINVTDKRVYLDATVNGHPGRFVFDTGAAGIVFTDSFARMVGAKRRGATKMFGIGGGFDANVYTVDSIALAGSTLHDVTIVTGIDERVDNGEHVDGYIGFDLLAGAIVDMDLDARTLRIYDPTVVAPDQKAGITVTVDLTTGQPRVPMTVGGSVPVLATVDSGDSFYVLFGSQLVSRERAKFFQTPGSLASQLHFYGVNGDEIDDCGRLESLEMGPISYRPVPACKSNSMSSNDVLVGFDFFKAFNYVFDYPDGELLLTPRKTR